MNSEIQQQTGNGVKPPESPAERLERIKAERAELAAARERREAASVSEEELERETRGLADDHAIEKAVEQHGPLGKKLAAIFTDMGVVIVKRASQLQFQRLMDTQKPGTEDHVKFVRPNVVHPDKITFDAYCDEQPAIVYRCSNQMLVLAGAKLQEVGGK